MKQFFDDATRIMVRLAWLVLLLPCFMVRAEEANSLLAVSASSAPNGKIVLKVDMQHPLSILPASFTINAPPRIAFDFPNTTNALGKTSQDFAEGDLRSVNVVQAGQRTRLVLNLNQMMTYDTQLQGNSLLVTLQGKITTGSGTAVTARFSEARPGVQQHGVRDIDFRRGTNGEGRIQVELSSADVGIDIKQQGKNLLVDFQKTHLPPNLRRKLDVTDFGTPVQMLDAYPVGDNVRLAIEPKGNWEYAAYQTDNKFIIEIKPVADDPNRLVKGGQIGYSGDKLTLNFQKIDVREALNVIADFTGLNMVISDSVTGSLTLRLKDVPWDQALDIILDSRGLDRRKNGNVIQVAPREEIAAKEKIDLAARQEITDLEGTRTESFQLSYSKAADIEKLLGNDKQRILSKRGSVVSDARTNTVFVQDTPSRLEEVRKLIKQIDVPVRQVLIEARFVEAVDTFSRTLGGRLNTSAPLGYRPSGSSGSTATGNVNLPNYTSGTGGLLVSLFSAGDSSTLNMELNASDIDGRTKNIASPRVVTGDKSEATIESGVEVPYLQASSSGATNVAFKKAVLSLKVTPQITPDDRVNMKVNVNQDVVGTVYSGVPSINTKQISTQVLVDNGGTVVIGGIYTQSNSESKQQVPLFGDIPLLGWLFKNETTTKNKNELLIFITPKILKDSLNIN